MFFLSLRLFSLFPVPANPLKTSEGPLPFRCATCAMKAEFFPCHAELAASLAPNSLELFLLKYGECFERFLDTLSSLLFFHLDFSRKNSSFGSVLVFSRMYCLNDFISYIYKKTLVVFLRGLLSVFFINYVI